MFEDWFMIERAGIGYQRLTIHMQKWDLYEFLTWAMKQELILYENLPVEFGPYAVDLHFQREIMYNDPDRPRKLIVLVDEDTLMLIRMRY
jgi:hypothetical protein